ncbi:nuclear transport factor 2 family protein [Phycicoccus sonneratiae]|uniref:Nuclear transport factor 2 family protein n=1 Tax=Phycicoccus sonneratiae TaxID=2807628 RepID=A0ABS2CI68_9MICO|nr:nuclear transport factor 2 family protein [Phycicoccus sonneraticus]MBM6399178.1 nuclear transport factor 2 family protein [Phycicoccus sonneraticus]
MGSIHERLVAAQNAHDPHAFAALFADDYVSEQPAHPGRAFTGRAQVRENWTAVFAGVPDFRAELVAVAGDGEVEWGEVAWSGHHVDGSEFAMSGVIVATLRDGLIASARLFVEPLERGGDIATAVEETYRPPTARPEGAGVG